MTSEFERPPRHIDRYYESVGSGLGRIVGFIVVIALAALLFTTFYGRTPSGPSLVTSEPGVTAPATGAEVKPRAGRVDRRRARDHHPRERKWSGSPDAEFRLPGLHHKPVVLLCDPDHCAG